MRKALISKSFAAFFRFAQNPENDESWLSSGERVEANGAKKFFERGTKCKLQIFWRLKAEIASRFVDDALLAGLDLVRIVHGKGVLAGKVRDYLRQKKLKYSVPPEKFGGDGVSEVRL